MRTGLIYSDRGSATVGIYPITNTNQEIPSYTKHEVPSSREFHDVHLETNQAGINIINVSDDTAGTILKWPDSTPMTVESSLETPTKFAGGRWTMYFYVPKDTKIIGGYRSAGAGSVKTLDGKTALTFTRDNNPGYWSIPVPAGQDGKLWQLYNVSGEVNLMTVPPYLARSADELLLPKEVVKMDAAK